MRAKELSESGPFVKRIHNSLLYDDFGIFVNMMSDIEYKSGFQIHKEELVPMIEPYKSYLIKKILIDVKHSHDDDNIEHESIILDKILRVIKRLKELGFNWSELDVINKSILHAINSYEPIYD